MSSMHQCIIHGVGCLIVSEYTYFCLHRMLLFLVSSNMKTLEHKPVFSMISSRCFRSMIMIMLQCNHSYWTSFKGTACV
ncbi:hypothetical protein SCLCIDRAFT_1216962, partial [Scleroderma citrinum Foug A]